MAVDFDAYNNGDAILNNLLVLGTAITFIVWFLVVCRNSIRIQELRSALENRSWLWLPGLSSYMYSVPRLSTEHLEKILSSRKELPSEDVPHIRVPLHLVGAAVEENEDGLPVLSCSVISTEREIKVTALWAVPGSLMELLESGETDADIAAELIRRAPYVSVLTLTANPAVTNDVRLQVQDQDGLASSPLFPRYNTSRSTGVHQEDNEQYGKAVEVTLRGAVPREVAPMRSALEAILTSNVATVEPLVLVLQSALPWEDVSKPQAMILAIRFNRSLQGRVARQVCLLRNQAPIEMLEIFGYEDNTDCVVCLSEEAEIILLPCRHVCVCATCFKEVDKCPVCRAEFETYIKFQQIEGGLELQESKTNKRSTEQRQRRRRLKFWRSKKKRG